MTAVSYDNLELVLRNGLELAVRNSMDEIKAVLKDIAASLALIAKALDRPRGY